VNVLMEPTHLLDISQVPSCLSVIVVATSVTVGSSLSSLGGTEPIAKKAHFEAFLRVSSWYMCGAACRLCSSCFSYFRPKTQKVISGWQESYLYNFDRSSVGYTPGDTPTPDPGSAIGNGRG
jgi:hypothetical protein